MKYDLPQKTIAVIVYPESKTVVACGHGGHRSMAPLKRCLRRFEAWADSATVEAFVTTATGPVGGTVRP
jgi:hypothetical protein